LLVLAFASTLLRGTARARAAPAQLAPPSSDGV